MPKAIYCPYFVQQCKTRILCEGGLTVEIVRKTEQTNFIQRYCGNLGNYKKCKNARALNIKYGEIPERRGRKKYNFTPEEIRRLIRVFKQHGWKPGYYMDFECSYKTCFKKLIELGYIKRNTEGKVND